MPNIIFDPSNHISKNQIAVTDIGHVHCKIHMCINTLEHVLIVNKVRDDDELQKEPEKR